MRAGPDNDRSASDQRARAPNTMIHSARGTQAVDSDVPVAALPLIVNALSGASAERRDVLDDHLQRLLGDAVRLQREGDVAAGLAQQAEITRELDELYAQIGRARALAAKRRRDV